MKAFFIFKKPVLLDFKLSLSIGTNNKEVKVMKIGIIAIIVLLSVQFGFAINPMKEYKMKPETFQLDYQELKLETPDGYKLNTWMMEPIGEVNKNVTIVIVGSDAGNMGFSLPYASYLLRSGYRVVTFDYRGFGDSTEFEYNPDNVYHSEYVTDFETVMNWCKEELKSEKIGVLAFSMGTLVSAIGYSATDYDFYIGEGFILSPQINKARINKIKNKNLFLPGSSIEDELKVQNMDLPTLLFASATDQITTLEDSLEFTNSRKMAKTVEFEGEHLRGASTIGWEKYVMEIGTFIDTI